MSRLTPQEVAQKHARNLVASTEDIRRGIERVIQSPMIKAAAKQEKMKTRLVAKIDDGTWAKNLKAVTLETWKDQASNVGVNRISAGIQAAQGKQEVFYSKLLPAVDAAKAKINSMPDTTLEDNIGRMTAYVREMSKFRK